MTASTNTEPQYAVSLRTGTPWMGLPGVSTDGDADQMFAAANLGGWNVETREVITDARVNPKRKDFEIIRTNPFDGGLDRLGMRKARYTPFQNEAVLDTAKAVTFGDVEPYAMGAFDEGRKVFMAFTLGDNIVLDPNGQADEIGRYFTMLTSHDGSLAITSYTGNFRLACQNQIQGSLSSALGMFKFKHTATAEGRVLDARKALGIALKADKELMADMEALNRLAVDEQKFWSIVESLNPRPEQDVKGSMKKWETTTDGIMALWHGPTLANLEDTAWKAYNALSEDLLWYPGIRAGNTESPLVKASGFDETTNQKNLGLYRAVLDLAA